MARVNRLLEARGGDAAGRATDRREDGPGDRESCSDAGEEVSGRRGDCETGHGDGGYDDGGHDGGGASDVVEGSTVGGGDGDGDRFGGDGDGGGGSGDTNGGGYGWARSGASSGLAATPNLLLIVYGFEFAMQRTGLTNLIVNGLTLSHLLLAH